MKNLSNSDFNNNQLNNVPAPTADSQASNKKYVDDNISTRLPGTKVGIENTITGDINQEHDVGHPIELDLLQTSYGIGPVIHGSKAAGTKSSPSAVGGGDLVWGIGSRPYDGTAFTPHSTAAIYWLSTETFSSTKHGTELGFRVTPTGSPYTTRTTVLYLNRPSADDGGRFQSDFSNADLRHRSYFQTRTANASTRVGALPNGTGTTSQLNMFNNSNPTDAGYMALRQTSASSDLLAGSSGSGTSVPFRLIVNNTTTVFEVTTTGYLTMNRQEAWTNATYQNGWSSYGSGYADAGYMKDSLGFVHLRGLAKGGTTTANTTIFTLPAGYRPENQLLAATASYNSAFGEVRILSTGEVQFRSGSGTYFSFDSIVFKAA